MFKDVFDYIDKDDDVIPKINPIIGRGFAYATMRDLHKSVDMCMRTLLSPEYEKDLPAGFSYANCEVLSPEEEYDERSKKCVKNVSRAKTSEGFNYLKTDTYMVRYNYNLKEKTHSRVLEITFLRPGSVTHVKGVRYSVSPVMKTRGVSTTQKGFFISFDANKINFEKMTRSFLCNGNTINYYLPISNDIHHIKKVGSKRFVPALVNWIFAKYGIFDAFKRYLDIDLVVLGLSDPKLEEYEDDDKYSVCKARPPLNKKETTCTVAIVVPKEKLTKEAEIFIGTFFYDCAFYGDILNEISVNEDEPALWKLILGYAVHGDVPGEKGYNQAKHIFMITKHLTETVDKFMDPIFIQQMESAYGVTFETTYDLFYYIVQLFTRQGSRGSSSVSSTWGRYLTCSEYLLARLRYSIRKCMWELKDAARDMESGTTGNYVPPTTIELKLNHRILTDTLTRITSGHGEVSPIQVTSDNMFIGLTARAIDEADAKKSTGSGRKTINLNDPTKHLHASWLETSSVNNLVKSGPFGFNTLNGSIKLGPDGRIEQKESNRELLKHVQLDLMQKGHRF